MADNPEPGRGGLAGHPPPGDNLIMDEIDDLPVLPGALPHPVLIPIIDTVESLPDLPPNWNTGPVGRALDEVHVHGTGGQGHEQQAGLGQGMLAGLPDIAVGQLPPLPVTTSDFTGRLSWDRACWRDSQT